MYISFIDYHLPCLERIILGLSFLFKSCQKAISARNYLHRTKKPFPRPQQILVLLPGTLTILCLSWHEKNPSQRQLHSAPWWSAKAMSFFCWLLNMLTLWCCPLRQHVLFSEPSSLRHELVASFYSEDPWRYTHLWVPEVTDPKPWRRCVTSLNDHAGS